MSSRVKADSGGGFGLRAFAMRQSSCSNSRMSFEGGAPCTGDAAAAGEAHASLARVLVAGNRIR
jgi:hypothetical protein